MPRWNADDGARHSEVRDDGDLIIRAEQALLGAVMSDPARQAAILDLIRPADMFRPYHGQVLAAMQRLRARGVAPAPITVRAELAADPEVPPRVSLDGVLLACLLEAAPRSGHAAAYGVIVIENGIRQHVLLAGSRLIQAAETGEVVTAVQMITQGGRAIRDGQARWNALPDGMRRELPDPAERAVRQGEEATSQLRAAGAEIGHARHDAHIGTPQDLRDRLESIARHIASAAAASQSDGRGILRTAGESRPHGSAAEAAGEQFLRDLAAGPGQVSAVRSWLRSAHFACPAHGHIYALIRDMYDAGKPVDPVTVAWEAARRGIPLDAADLEGGTAPFALASAREVHRHGLLARISQAGHDIGAAATDPQVQLSALLRAGGQRLCRLEREHSAQSGWQMSPDGKPQIAARPGSPLSPRPSRAAREPDDWLEVQRSTASAEPA